MDLEERVALVTRNSAEVLMPEEVRTLLERETHPRAYIGYEPSGLLHVGHLLTVSKARDLERAGFEVTILLADWHAMINDKLGGSLERIQASGSLFEPIFRALGAGDRVKFRWASDLIRTPEYWPRVIRCAKAMTLARVKRAVTIMGRKENEGDVDTAKLFYPPMQVADIFELPVDLAYAGTDQRRAHVLAREVAHHYNWPVPIALHTPLISSLKGGGRMNMDDSGLVELKMSKSDPTSCIPLPAEDAIVDERLRGAFCTAKEVEGNPVLELARDLVLPWEGHLVIDRPAKFGGRLELASSDELLSLWKEGKLHPQDLKAAVAGGIKRIIAPVNRYFAEHPKLLSAAPAAPDVADRK